MEKGNVECGINVIASVSEAIQRRTLERNGAFWIASSASTLAMTDSK
ncbi:MAG: hypothetical protein K2K24_01195 [Clostridia bacterium]|nr:hypothetical protein [Clostridia bacterium]